MDYLIWARSDEEKRQAFSNSDEIQSDDEHDWEFE
jgi:hypothetical protein